MKQRLFAEGTTVSSEKSKAEIESMLSRYGADQFMSGWGKSKKGSDMAVIGFKAEGRLLRFELELPDRKDEKFRFLRGYRERPEWKVQELYEAECRRRWRSLALVIKAKLEAVQSQVETFETAFMANVVMPDGKTVAQHVRPWIAHSYAQGEVRGLLPEFSGE